MSRHRSRPRYGRIAAVLSSLGVTVVAVLGGTGVLSAASSTSEREAPAATSVGSGVRVGAAEEMLAVDPVVVPEAEEAAVGTAAADTIEKRAAARIARAERRLPSDSGSGLRVVFSESRQRVWLVGAQGRVQRTYLVSGSIYDNLDPGTYEVFSRSEQAWGINDSGTMKYFVRFAHGPNAAIGFHDIPIANGSLVQGFDELGTPLSHGCIRQRRTDAIALWDFAPLGTTVVVTT